MILRPIGKKVEEGKQAQQYKFSHAFIFSDYSSRAMFKCMIVRVFLLEQGKGLNEKRTVTISNPLFP